jgi:hypothetical protein
MNSCLLSQTLIDFLTLPRINFDKIVNVSFTSFSFLDITVSMQYKIKGLISGYMLRYYSKTRLGTKTVEYTIYASDTISKW